MHRIFCLVLLLVASACGYRWQLDYPSTQRPTISVPFVVGDEDGVLTSEIIRALTASGLAEISHKESDFRLSIVLKEVKTETVGYRRDRQKISGKIKKNLLASEGRKTICAEAILYQGSSDQEAFGPYQISVDADYDYVDGDSIQDLAFINKEGAPVTVLQFSLGQLESIEAAQEAANRPLYEKLAQKIVDAIFSEW